MISPPTLVLIFLAAYLCGSVPFGLLLTRFFGHGDIRAIGSGNIGATNVLRTGSKKLAAATLLLDGFKAVPLALWLQCQANVTAEYWPVAIAAFGALIGHVFPIWLRFKGGKGVATFLGGLFVLSPLSCLMFVGVWLGMFAVKRISSLSALAATWVVEMIAVSRFFLLPDMPITLPQSGFVLIGGSLLFYTHRANIARLRAGTEPQFGAKAQP